MNVSGTVWWNELRTSDEQGAIDFYSRLVGWQPFRLNTLESLKPAQEGEPLYTVWMKGWSQVGGMMKMSSCTPAVSALWFPFIAVDNVDECARLAVELGGRVVEAPFDVPNAGRFALLCDPQGATFGVGKPSRAEAQ